MPEAPIPRFRGDCDGCGATVPSRGPVGWYVRTLDPRYYKGPRQILFCPHCFANLPARLRRRWQRLEPEHAASWLETLAHRLLRGHSPRRGTVG
jgi:hypothetical protein